MASLQVLRTIVPGTFGDFASARTALASTIAKGDVPTKGTMRVADNIADFARRFGVDVQEATVSGRGARQGASQLNLFATGPKESVAGFHDAIGSRLRLAHPDFSPGRPDPL